MTVFIETTDDGLLAQIDNFLLKAATYPSLGLDATKQTNLRKDWTLMKYVVSANNIMDTNSTAFTTFKNVLRKGGTLGVLPPIPVLAAAPPITSGGMEKRFRDLVQDAVRSTAMTDTIAQDLGIVAPASPTQESVNAGKPTYKITYSSGGYPLIIWKKGSYEGVEIHKSKDGVNFSKLDRDFKPDFIDKSDLPEPAKAEVWYYKLIYLINDEQVGQWSDVQSIAVNG
ncbi:MAG: hypothetical protein NTZ59_01010 [Bacteroidetes bacterium]|nr:hypothetical protein [Bacteroidota bacterium]